MISCLLSKKDDKILMEMFVEKARLQKEAELDPTKIEVHITQRNLIVTFVMDKLGPAMKARIATWTARKYCNEADAESLVYEHLLIAVDKYKPERGKCKFTSFLWTVSNRAFSNFISAANRSKRNPNTLQSQHKGQQNGQFQQDRALISLDEVAEYEESTSLSSTVSDSSNIEDKLQYESLLTLVYKKCTDQQKVIVDLLQQNYTYREIAEITQSTPAIVSRQLQSLKKTLKDDLKNTRVTS